jgi:hypothetical protein
MLACAAGWNAMVGRAAAWWSCRQGGAVAEMRCDAAEVVAEGQHDLGLLEALDILSNFIKIYNNNGEKFKIVCIDILV